MDIIEDYGTLKAAIAEYLHRDDLTASIPTFISLAQNRISRDLKLFSSQTTTTLAVTAGMKEVVLPDDFRKMLALRIPSNGGSRPILQKSLTGNSVGLNNGGASGAPNYYARYGRIIELTPTPEADTTLTIIYKTKLAAFTLDTDTDLVLTDNPNIYVYGTMLEAMPFLKDQDNNWQAMYMGEVATINEEDYEEEWSGSPLEIISLGMDTP